MKNSRHLKKTKSILKYLEKLKHDKRKSEDAYLAFSKTESLDL